MADKPSNTSNEPEADLGHTALDATLPADIPNNETDHEKILRVLEEEAALAQEQQAIEQELHDKALAEIVEKRHRLGLDLDIQREEYGED